MATRNDDTQPMAEPGTRPQGASTGGMAATADGGLNDAYQRSFERGLEDATGAAGSGDAMTTGTSPRTDLGGKNEPGAAPGSRSGVDEPGAAPATVTGTRSADLADGGRASVPSERSGPVEGRGHGAGRGPGEGTPPNGSPGGDPTRAGEIEDLPEAPADESAAQSLGRAVSEVVTGVFDAPADPRDKERR